MTRESVPVRRRAQRAAAALLAAGVLLAGCTGGGWGDDARAAGGSAARDDGFPQAEVWIGSSTVPEDEPIQVGDQVRVEAVKVVRATFAADTAAERRARWVWTSRDPAVATVDSAGRVTALSPGRTTIVARLDPASLPPWAPAPGSDSTYVHVVPVNAALAGLRFRALAISRSDIGVATCAATEDGVTYCWGGEMSGDTERSPFGPVPGGARFTSVTRGVTHGCGLTAEGRALCWGGSAWGALGTGLALPSRHPVPVAGQMRFAQLSAGYDHTCGVTTGAELLCWGSNLGGETGPRSTDRCTFPVSVMHRRRHARGPCSMRPVRVLPGVPVHAVAAGDAHTCALDAGGVPWCWGDDYNQQVPQGGGVPTRVATDQRFTRLWAGSRHTCALTAAGEAYCWGGNGAGEQGAPPPPAGSRVPLRVPASVRFSSLAPGEDHTCGIDTAGHAWCWGSDWGGKLGTGTDTHGTQAPAPVARGLRFRELAAGQSHTCGVTLAGGVYCWGSGLDFDLEGGTLNHRTEPVRIAGPQG